MTVHAVPLLALCTCIYIYMCVCVLSKSYFVQGVVLVHVFWNITSACVP